MVSYLNCILVLQKEVFVSKISFLHKSLLCKGIPPVLIIHLNCLSNTSKVFYVDLLYKHSHGDIHYPFNSLYSDGFPIHIDTICKELPIVHFKESQVVFFLSLMHCCP